MNAAEILAALGGRENVVTVDSCITRLRVVVKDADAVNEEGLVEAGAFGSAITGHDVQVVVGPAADDVAREIDELP
ncbi:MAG: PTS transporter subunit EIIB [Ruaniaceae bacterium]|nr:PTS transporter subunit EIIB [Ruaniaceae bacterium]